MQKSLETTIRIGKNRLGQDNNPYWDQMITPDAPKLGPDKNFTAYMYIYIYTYICCRVKSWSKICLFKVKTGSSFLISFVFFYWSNLLHNILGPVFNLYLEQLLRFEICHFLFLTETTILKVLSAKHAKSKDAQNRRNTICEHTSANCSCQNVHFFCIFHVGFSEFPKF